MIPWSPLLSQCEGYHLVCARKWIRNWTSCYKQILLKRCQKVRLARFSFGSCTLVWWWHQDLCRCAAYTRSDYQRETSYSACRGTFAQYKQKGKVDLKWGFHQILLSEGSRHITTFVTHRGMCQYKWLMFGMTSAPGKNQQIVRDVLEGCEGVVNTTADLIIHGNSVEEHDRRLFAVLDSLKWVGLMLIVASVNSAYQGLPFSGTNWLVMVLTLPEDCSYPRSESSKGHQWGQVVYGTSAILCEVHACQT